MKHSNLLSFFIAIEDLKTIMRHSWTTDKNRQESSAEHSWAMALIAMALFDHLEKKVDERKVLQLVIFHDLAEIITKDIPAFEKSKRQEKKHEAEQKALRKLLKPLPLSTRKQFLSLWEEFEENKTYEAHIAQGIDKMEVLIQHNIADISTWDQGDFNIHPFYRTELFDFDRFFRTLRDEVEMMSFEKITTTGNEHRIKPHFAEKYKKKYKI
ncbi:MAG TPA: HD domain-containing protein [Patescibacteria group bacterium]|nr:HD domain-containing protein [Patescibacteria group bacterium]